MEKPLNHIPEIDGLRGIAVLSVVLFHFFPEHFKIGFLGVDVFFIISGFLITRILVSEKPLRSGAISNFYFGRFRRIFPAFFGFFILSYLISLFLLAPHELKQLGRELINGSLMVTNWVQKKGYFDDGSSLNPFLHLWSLSVEVQFYLLYPLLLWGWLRLGFSALSLVLILFVPSLVFCVYLHVGHSMIAFYNALGRVWEFMIGACLAIALIQGWRVKLELPFKRWLLNKGLIGLGLISYSLYLWHWFFLFIARLEFGGDLSFGFRFLLIIGSVVFSVGSYLFIEQPCRRLTFSKKNLALGFAGWVFLAFVGEVNWKNGGFPKRMQWLGPAISEVAVSQLQGTQWEYGTNTRCLEKYPFTGAHKSNWWFCMLNHDAPISVLVLGSSYANHLYPGLVSHTQLRHQTFLSIGTCDPVGNFAKNPIHPCFGKNFEKEQAFVNKIIEQSPSLRYVILSGFRPPNEVDENYIEAFRQRVRFFNNKGIELILVLPHAQYNYDIRGCYPRPFRSSLRDCRINSQRVDDIIKKYKPIVNELTRDGRKVYYFDPNSVFFDGVGYSAIKDGLPLFRDQTSHFSVFGSEQVAERFVRWAQEQRIGIVSDKSPSF